MDNSGCHVKGNFGYNLSKIVYKMKLQLVGQAMIYNPSFVFGFLVIMNAEF